ncbi:MAG: amidohydrolase family protein [Gemmatimonadota bacterium]
MRSWVRARERSRLAAAAVLLTAGLATHVAAQDLVLENAHIVDPRARTVIEGRLVIRAGRVAAAGADAPVPPGAPILDVQGRWVIPGLFDLHTHSFGNAAMTGPGQMTGPVGTARLALRAGVTGFLDLFSMEDMILGVRDRQRAEGLPGADVFAAGPCLTATGGHCSEYGVPTRLVDTPEDAWREVDALALKRPDVVKLVYDHNVYGGRSLPTLDRATLQAVVEAAHSHALKTIVHVGTWQDLQDAVEAGADAVTHTPGPGPMPPGVAALMVQKGTLHIPTLAVQSELARIARDPALLDRPLLVESVDPSVLDSYRDPAVWPARMQGFLAWVRSLERPNLEAVSTLAAAGVRIGAGTDAGNPGVFQGYSVHREMELLVEAGLSEWDALAAATVVPMEFLGHDWGVEAGAEATVLVLDASPLVDIRNTQRIHAVIQRGVRVAEGGS